MNRMRVPVNVPPANMNRPMSTGFSRGTGRRSMGARLEIAGVVVGSWGANYNMSQTPYEPSPYMMHPTPVMNFFSRLYGIATGFFPFLSFFFFFEHVAVVFSVSDLF